MKREDLKKASELYRLKEDANKALGALKRLPDQVQHISIHTIPALQLNAPCELIYPIIEEEIKKLEEQLLALGA